MVENCHREVRPEGRRTSSPSASLDPLLDHLDAPLLVIDSAFRILNSNDKARAALGCRPEETNFGRHIVGEAPGQSLEMRRKAKEAILSCGRTVLMLDHPRHKRLICSIKGIRAGPAGAQGLVALAPVDQGLAAVAVHLRDIYGLSRTEAEIALAAAAGAEVAQMVLDRKVSVHTLRAQIASIKSKMGHTRMTEIAVAVARIQAMATLI